MDSALQTQLADHIARAVKAPAQSNAARSYQDLDPCWVAIRHPSLPGFQRKRASCPTQMTQGTLMFELPLGHLAGVGPLLRADLDEGRLDLWLDRQMGLVLRVKHGQHRFEASIDLRGTEMNGHQRIALTWNLAQQSAWFGLWGAAHGGCRITRVSIDTPLPHGLMRGAVTAPAVPGLSAALALGQMPLGALPGFGETCVVDTPRGPIPMAELRPGDKVLTEDGQPARVTWAGRFVLPRTQLLSPVVLRAPYWGLARDLRLTIGQELSLTGNDISYLFDAPRVRVPIANLGNLPSVRFMGKRPVGAYCGIVLDRPGQIIVNGAAFDAAFAGNLLRSGSVAGTVLADLPAPLRRKLDDIGGAPAHMLGPLEVDSLMRFRND